MEEIQNNERTSLSIIERLDRAMINNSGDQEKIIDYNKNMVQFNKTLEAEFGREVLGCVKEWHKMIGSSLSSIDGYGGEEAIDSEVRRQIIFKIENFVSQFEK